ncbi:hypothetical protein NNJEOMEG_03787 [Fundidesulfovibrio magnetotacticus]|uniref:Uncharacterized protein n=1 Tax=Fundidesulfovibrio magnetotacticus TaxID=2730080 RepID=A0A6V8LVZ7_9BACT|nr:hypothetical protein NNJEOMEG_03787 [Fundidesulfovibrio magnetotacticus]
MRWEYLELNDEQTRLGKTISKTIGWTALASFNIAYLIKLYCEWGK